MKTLIFAFAFCLALSSIHMAQTSEINIIPKPKSVKTSEGHFLLSRKTRIIAYGVEERTIATVLNDFLMKNYGMRLKILAKTLKNDAIILEPSTAPGDLYVNVNAYSLSIKPELVRLFGSESGMFYGLQSLLQLLPSGSNKEISLPAVQIEDEPRFGYRGMHLDVGRHFMPVEFVKKYIDLMSQYKFNYFHWHLTEDQGWRIEIKKYPKLTEVGSKRPETVKEKDLQPYIGDGVPHDGFYTQEQIKDVVAYAKARYITVIPEIELPGHSSAALAAYPELGCKADYKYKVQATWGIFKEVYCPTEKTFAFLEDVLTEVIGLFPDTPYIHIGGDEVLKDMWKESPEVKELMARENLKDEHEVQSYFIRRMEKFINSKGKKIIGWDEILEGGLAPNATVMSWRGIKGGIEAAKAHHDVIMTPTDSVYFDFGQGDPAYEPINIGNYVTLEKVYGFDPVPKELNADEAKYILGGQANVWTEYMLTPEKVEYMALPRMIALSEALWSKPEDKNFTDFSKRLASQFSRLDKQSVNYRIPEPLGITNKVLAEGEKADLHLEPPIPDSRVFYTIDGSTPDEKSTPYTKPLQIDVPDNGRVDLKSVVVLSSGRKSSVYAATLLRKMWQNPEPEPKDKRPGATYGLAFTRTDGAIKAIVSGESKIFGVQQFGRAYDLKQPFGVNFDGYINVPVDGIYEFQIESTWDAAIYIGGEKLVDSAGTKDRSIHAEVVPLKAGLHKISLWYNNHGGEPFWRVRWAIKGQQWRNVGGSELVH